MTALSREESLTLDAAATNHAHWQDLARVHGNGDDAYYDVEALIGGRSAMTEHEEAALDFAGGVSGRDVLHIQCHLGFDAITFAQRGARVTGLDFSEGALEKAASIAARAGVSVNWTRAEATRLPDTLAARFDLAYASIGAICWIGELSAWMKSAARALRPGGRLVLVDLHPAYGIIGSLDPLVVDFPYSFDGPRAFREPGSYANPNADVKATTSVAFAHDLGEVVNSAIAAGLRIDRLFEHTSCAFDPRGSLAEREADGRYRVRLGGKSGFPVPMLFTLVATKPE